MLKKLKILEFTLIKKLEVEFKKGFQVLTGETGAGKSVIIGAIALLCGQRGQGDVVRSGADKSILEMEFELEDVNKVNNFLRSIEIDSFGNHLIIRREINRKGLSRIFINDTPASLNQVANLSALLVDLHGQHQHQKLLHVENHRKYLDDFASLNKNLADYKDIFDTFNQKQADLSRLQEKKKNSSDQHDLYTFQIAELEKAKLDENELHELRTERLKLENSEQLFEVAQFVGSQLYSSENSILTAVSQAMNKLKSVEEIDNNYKELLTNLNSAQVIIEDIGRTAELLKEKIEFNPERLEEIRNREVEIDWLVKKYQAKDVSDLISYFKKLKQEIHRFQNFDDEIEQLKYALESQKKELIQKAIEISEIRKSIAAELESQMVKTMISLGMNNARFLVKITWIEEEDGIIEMNSKKYKSSDTGIDNVEYLVSMNKGEPLKPLQKVASGGEISRIMLAIKSVLNNVDDTNTMIFDEIDSGISGKIAQIVGNKFQNIGENKQLIVITHLPQIASQAKNHFAVNKSEIDNRTSINIQHLNSNERVIEIAKLLGGDIISTQAIANARNLLENSITN